ncbi:hypothetical protein ACHQM5_005379 [Ranunculus cassubicifolius]
MAKISFIYVLFIVLSVIQVDAQQCVDTDKSPVLCVDQECGNSCKKKYAGQGQGRCVQVSGIDYCYCVHLCESEIPANISGLENPRQ